MSETGLAAAFVSRWRGLETRVGRRIAATLEVLVVALASAAIAWALALTTPVRFVETLTQDLRVMLTAPVNRTPMVIVKMDDRAIDAMRAASPCHCLSPIDKRWLAGVIADLDAKGVRAIAVDYLMDSWSSPEEQAAFQQMALKLHAPLVVVVDPSLRPGIDYPVLQGVRYSDARTLISDDYDDVVRRYDARPGRLPGFAAEVVRAVGVAPPTSPFFLRYRKPDPSVSGENAGAVAPSFSAAFVHPLPDSFFRGRIAFIGRTTRSAGADADTPKEDMHLTPLRFLPGNAAGTPGVEVHAHAVAQMIDGDRITPMTSLQAMGLVLVAALVGALVGRAAVSLWLSLSLLVAGAAAAGAFALVCFADWSLLTPAASPALAFAIGFFLLSRIAAARLSSERAFYATTLERYLSPSVISRIVDGAEPLKIGAETREITVLISDLENFSGLVADTPVDRFSRIMNDYLGELTEILWKHEALIDKLTGDGVVAIFGAPVAQPDHARRALACARDIHIFAEAFRARAAAAGTPVGRTRMGINSGDGLVGNFGGPRRFNYTAYGQVVVIAARLEAENKAHGTTLLFSEETWHQAQPVSGARPVGEVQLKGVEQAVRAYTLDVTSEASGA